MDKKITAPNYLQTVEFLLAFHPDGPWHLIAIGENKGPRAKTFTADLHHQMEQWISQENGRGGNIYFSVNALKPEVQNRKSNKKDVERIHAFHVDVDDLSDQTLTRLTNFDPKPSIILCSGGGYQAFWLLDRAQERHVDLIEAETINKAIADQVGGDDCFNIDRIMRVPGTINYPNTKKRAAGRTEALAYLLDQHTDFSRTYTLESFADLGQTNSALAIDASNVASADIPITTIAELGLDDDEPVVTLILEGDDTENPRGSKSSRFPSRSEAVFSVCCTLARRGVEPIQIAGLLLNPDFGISQSILEKPNPAEYAYRQADKALATVTTAWPDTTKLGYPRMSYRNALYGVIRMGISFENDAFHNRKRIGGHQLQSFQGNLSDDACAMLRKGFVDEFGFDPGKGNILDAVQVLCLENTFHPICDYLDGLSWDGVSRLDTFLIDYFRAEDTPLNRAIGKMMLVAAVRRVRQPGVKFDTMIVLEGPQGSGKSTALAILAGDDNFSDQNLFALDAKAQMEAMEGVWFYEVAELSGLRHTDITLIKSFITRTEDRGRPAYARFKETWPRQCILVGTTV